MSNIIALDTAIGIIFIFLLYSLLATTIKESIATLFGLRARMLKKGIIEGMLSDSSNDNRWISILKGIWSYVEELDLFFSGRAKKNNADSKLGLKFYDHPLIRNYGSNRVFPTPSYLPPDNFSAVLLDVLKGDFSSKIQEIASYKISRSGATGSLADVSLSLQASSDMVKIKELLDYYEGFYSAGNVREMTSPIINRDTAKILSMNMKNSVYNLDAFTKSLEDWFNESMDRVSGWYKRQVQVILFLIGLAIAMVFNVDIIEIVSKLSKDKDARSKMVELAIQSADKYKEDPRVKKSDNSGDGGLSRQDSTNSKIFDSYQRNVDSAKTIINQDIKNANDVLAIGWSDYGRSQARLDVLKCHPLEVERLRTFFGKDSQVMGAPNQAALINQRVADSLLSKYSYPGKISFVLRSSLRPRKLLGFLILAFAVCLGAPFWFDLLNKIIKLRATGTPEGPPVKSKKSSNTPPMILNVKTKSSGEEAVG